MGVGCRLVGWLVDGGGGGAGYILYGCFCWVFRLRVG